MYHIRSKWLQILIVCTALGILNWCALYLPSTTELRNRSAEALQSILLIFTVTSALTLMIFSNYVRGIRSSMVELASSLKNRLWIFYDQFHDSEQPILRSLIEEHVLPFLTLSLQDCLQLQNFHNWGEGIEQKTVELEKLKNGRIIPAKYLLPIEDILYELGTFYIKSIVAPSVYSKLVTGVFQLIGCAMIVVAAHHLLSDRPVINIIIANASVSAISYAILKLFIAISWVKQEAREEEAIERE